MQLTPRLAYAYLHRAWDSCTHWWMMRPSCSRIDETAFTVHCGPQFPTVYSCLRIDFNVDRHRRGDVLTGSTRSLLWVELLRETWIWKHYSACTTVWSVKWVENQYHVVSCRNCFVMMLHDFCASTITNICCPVQYRMGKMTCQSDVNDYRVTPIWWKSVADALGYHDEPSHVGIHHLTYTLETLFLRNAHAPT